MNPASFVSTGCHRAVSLPLPKCERCVKRCAKSARFVREALCGQGFTGLVVSLRR